jgi:hypothetical protein
LDALIDGIYGRPGFFLPGRPYKKDPLKMDDLESYSITERDRRMTVQTTEEKPVIKFYLPSLTRNKHPILPEKIDAAIAFIEARLAKQNGGWTTYKAKGGYAGADGSIHRERIQVIEIFGENPFSEQEISGICKALDQEALFVQESGKSKAYLYDGEIREPSDFYQEVVSEGEIIRYYKEPVPFGKGYKIFREITDDVGTSQYFGEVRESEMCQRIFEGDQSIIQMMQHLGVSL